MNLDAQLTRTMAARYFGYTPSAIDQWRKREYLTPLANGRYLLRDLLAADKTARDNAQRIRAVA